MLVLGGLKVMSGELTVGMLVAFQTLMAASRGRSASFVSLGASLQEVEGDMNRLDDVLRYPPTRRPRRSAQPGPARTRTAGADGKAAAAPAIIRPPGRAEAVGRVELRGITFGYSPLDRR